MLSFPNRSRSYDPSHHRVRFIGHDGPMVVAFLLDSDAIERLDPLARPEESSALSSFDKNIDRILEAAAKAYRTARKNAYLLKAADF